MKEITEWDNNPREMWVWDDKSEKRKRKVIFIVPSCIFTPFPVIAVTEDGKRTVFFQHCAEIEPSRRLMTNKELARWIREKPNREWKEANGAYVHDTLIYRAVDEDKEVDNYIYVREGDSPWFVPFVEEE